MSLTEMFRGADPFNLTPYQKYRLNLGMESGWFLMPHQLDTTQPEDIKPGPYLRTPTKSALSCHYNLSVATLGEEVLYNRINNKYGILAEITRRGNRRCTYVNPNGRRCQQASDDGVCRFHRKNAYMTNTVTAYETQSVNLNEAYRKHLADPQRKTLDNEVALMRGCLTVMLDLFGKEKELAPQEVAMIMAITEKVSATVDRMSKIEARLKLRMTPEEVMRIISSFITTVDRMFAPTPAQTREMIDSVQSLMTVTTVDAPKDPPHVTIKSTPLTRYTKDGGTFTASKEEHLRDKILQHKTVASNNKSPRNREEAENTVRRLEVELEMVRNEELYPC
jgi:hypothetical protein